MIGSQPRTHPPIPCPSRRTTVRPACTWCTLAQDAAPALDAAECTWNMVRPCTIIYLPTYLSIDNWNNNNLHAKNIVSLYNYIYIYIFIYVQDTINFFAKDHVQCFHRAAAGGCGTKLRIVVVQGLRGAALLRWHPHVPWQGRWRFWDLEVLNGCQYLMLFLRAKKGEPIFLEIDWGEIFWWSPTANRSFWCGGPLDHVWCQDGHWGLAMSWTIWEGSSRCTLMAHPNSGWRSPWCPCRARRLVKAVGSVLRIF